LTLIRAIPGVLTPFSNQLSRSLVQCFVADQFGSAFDCHIDAVREDAALGGESERHFRISLDIRHRAGPLVSEVKRRAAGQASRASLCPLPDEIKIEPELDLGV
jgi:hypothetical protein